MNHPCMVLVNCFALVWCILAAGIAFKDRKSFRFWSYLFLATAFAWFAIYNGVRP